MPEEGSLPPRNILYHRSKGEANGKTGPEEGKTGADRTFFKLVKFAGQNSRREARLLGNTPPSKRQDKERE